MKVAILICPLEVRRVAAGFMSGAAVQAAEAAYGAGAYTERHEICFNGMTGNHRPEEMANECFDLTNNPGRQRERELFYGRHASLSVGDVVEIQDHDDPGKFTAMLCMSFGWKKIKG